MKLYGFNYRKGKVTKTVYDVRETERLYIIEGTGIFENVFSRRLNKSEIGKMIRQDSYFGCTMFLLTDDEGFFLKKILEIQKEKVKFATEKLNKEKEYMTNLTEMIAEYEEEQKNE